MITRFHWVKGYPAKIPAAVAGKRLAHLEQRHHRVLKPDDVVSDARDKRSPLHKVFEWDNEKASHAWRKQQARMMLASIRTVVVNILRPKDEPRIVKVYPNVRDRSEERAYHNVQDVLSDKVMRRNLLAQALREFKSWRDRYAELKELVAIFEAGDAIIGRVPRQKAM